jgi:Tol biopolymer transport system component
MKTKLCSKTSIHGLMFFVLLVCGVVPTSGQSSVLRANGKIAFTSDRDGNREIYVMNPDGTNQVRLTNNSVVDDFPTWSPDGTRIAFVRERPTGGSGLCLMNADGTNQLEITLLNSAASSLSWSPDGRQIAFQETFEGPTFNADILVVNADGSNLRNLTSDNPSWDQGPAWSPDGSKILFSSYHSGDIGPILHTIRPDGTDLQPLPNGFANGFGDFSPNWSPSGNKIVFIVNVWDFDDVIFTANSDGTNRQFFDGCPQLGCGSDRFNPTWSPDGSKIIFHIWDRFHTVGEIYLKNTDGSGFTQLTNGPGRNFNPSWQPLVSATCHNPIDCADLFVRQHYLDFLNREPDTTGLTFWTNEITSCGANTQCAEVKRINVSAAFFLSIEFQETGYLVYRTYAAAFGPTRIASTVPLTRSEFLPDVQRVGQGVVVGAIGWKEQLEANKTAYFNEFVQRHCQLK